MESLKEKLPMIIAIIIGIAKSKVYKIGLATKKHL